MSDTPHEMAISGIAPWFGAKRNLAPEIVREIGEHRGYWEPFCGSCAVLLAKPQTPCETVNDYHGELINLARVLSNEGLAVQLYARLSRFMMHETLFREAAELLERIEDEAGTVIYCDPPYLTKGAKYIHDFADTDHGRLADLLRRFRRARVIVSYYADTRLQELYPAWTVRTFDVSKAMAGCGGRMQNDVRATEVLLINGPSYANEFPLFD